MFSHITATEAVERLTSGEDVFRTYPNGTSYLYRDMAVCQIHMTVASSWTDGMGIGWTNLTEFVPFSAVKDLSVECGEWFIYG